MKADKITKEILKNYYVYKDGDWCVPTLHPKLNKLGVKIQRETLRKRLDELVARKMIKKAFGSSPAMYFPISRNAIIGIVEKIIEDIGTRGGKEKVKRYLVWIDKTNRELDKIYGNKVITYTGPFKDTSIEIKLQEGLEKEGVRFDTQKRIFGIPDIFIEPNICIFADGDYWHNSPRQKLRDHEVNERLTQEGYKVLRFWEHDINDNTPGCIQKIKDILVHKESS